MTALAWASILPSSASATLQRQFSQPAQRLNPSQDNMLSEGKKPGVLKLPSGLHETCENDNSYNNQQHGRVFPLPLHKPLPPQSRFENQCCWPSPTAWAGMMGLPKVAHYCARPIQLRASNATLLVFSSATTSTTYPLNTSAPKHIKWHSQRTTTSIRTPGVRFLSSTA